jgi:hypothetical protein
MLIYYFYSSLLGHALNEIQLQEVVSLTMSDMSCISGDPGSNPGPTARGWHLTDVHCIICMITCCCAQCAFIARPTICIVMSIPAQAACFGVAMAHKIGTNKMQSTTLKSATRY